MIGKVIRGTNTGRLLYYLFGPGRFNEHADPHLVAGFGDPADLEPGRRADGSRDVRWLTALLTQPLVALAGPGYAKPVWHCAVRAAPGDRLLSDAEWAQVATAIMDRTRLAPTEDDQGVRWVAVRHAPDHIHLVVTLARQDGTRPRIWNDFYRVREACQDAERQFGLAGTAPADRTAARCPTRAETEQAARRGWVEPPRVRLRRDVTTAAAGAPTEREFLDRLAGAGVLVRLRHSPSSPGQVTGYAVGLAEHTSRDGGVIWYGGRKLAADLTLPKLRAHWATAMAGTAPDGEGLAAGTVRAILRNEVTRTAGQAGDEAGFFARLRDAGVLVRLRHSETDSESVTGYAVTLPGHAAQDGTAIWYGGERLAARLTLPQLRRGWDPEQRPAPEQPDPGRGSVPGRSGAFRFTAPERDAIYAHAARQAAAAAEHIRGCAYRDPRGAADAAHAAAGALHVAARALRGPELRCAADAYDRAARAPYGRLPRRTRDGSQLRATARLLGLLGNGSGDVVFPAAGLMASFAALADAVAELRQAQQHAAQAAAARAAAEQLHTAMARARSQRIASHLPLRSALTGPGRAAPADYPVGPHPQGTAAGRAQERQRSGPRPMPRRRAGPAP